MTDALRPHLIRERLRGLGDRPRYRLFSERGGAEGIPLRPAAVLIALTEIEGEMHVVLTQRSRALKEHSGEVSFPGGKADPEDNGLLDTALREAEEEIRLMREAVTPHGILLSMPTITGYEVTAFVGEYGQPYSLSINPNEIESLLLAPLVELADPERHHIEDREFRGKRYPIHFFDIRGYTVWGATGLMVHTLLDFLGARVHTTTE